MTAKEEEEYWKRKIAMLSQPVTAQGLGGGGGGSSSSGGSNGAVSAPARHNPYRAQPSRMAAHAPNGVLSRAIAGGAAEKYNEPAYSSPLSYRPAPARRDAPQGHTTRSPAARQQRHADFGFKASDQASPVPASRRAGNRNQRTPVQDRRSHSGQPVRGVPQGFPETPPGWARAQDKKSGRFYLYNAKGETRWETDRQGRLYKK